MRSARAWCSTSPDKDQATIITSGIMVDESLKAYEALQAEGINVRVIDMFTWKPLDEELVIKAARETGAIVTAENHNVTCGLGSVVANCLVKNAPAVQEFVGVQDLFGQVGPQDFLMDEYGLRAANIVAAVKEGHRPQVTSGYPAGPHRAPPVSPYFICKGEMYHGRIFCFPDGGQERDHLCPGRCTSSRPSPRWRRSSS